MRQAEQFVQVHHIISLRKASHLQKQSNLLSLLYNSRVYYRNEKYSRVQLKRWCLQLEALYVNNNHLGSQQNVKWGTRLRIFLIFRKQFLENSYSKYRVPFIKHGISKQQLILDLSKVETTWRLVLQRHSYFTQIR